MTKKRFLNAYRVQLILMYSWASDKAKCDKYMESVTNTVSNGANTWSADGEALQKAWREIGMRSKATLKGLRALPID